MVQTLNKQALDEEYRHLWQSVKTMDKKSTTHDAAHARICEIEDLRDFTSAELRVLRKK